MATCYRRQYERLSSSDPEKAEQEWKTARVLFETALQRKVALLGHEDLTVANVKSHLGRLHKSYDNLSLAIAYYREVSNLRSKERARELSTATPGQGESSGILVHAVRHDSVCVRE